MPATSASLAGGAEVTSGKEPNFAIQHELEQFIVAERFRAGFPEALSQPFTMAVKMRWDL